MIDKPDAIAARFETRGSRAIDFDTRPIRLYQHNDMPHAVFIFFRQSEHQRRAKDRREHEHAAARRNRIVFHGSELQRRQEANLPGIADRYEMAARARRVLGLLEHALHVDRTLILIVGAQNTL